MTMNAFQKVSFSIFSCAISLFPLQANLIFHDNFNTVDSTNLNLNLGTRQTGSQANQTYDKILQGGGSAEISGNALVLTDGNAPESYAELNLDFGSLPGLTAFTVEFDMYTIGNIFGVFALAGVQNPGSGRPAVDINTDLGLLFFGAGHSSDGEIGVREGTGESSRATPAFGLTGSVRLSVNTPSISTGNPFTVDMTINGNDVDLNGALSGNTFSNTWSTNSLYMSFASLDSGGGGSTKSTFDNFAVTAIPEPASLIFVLTGMSLLGLVFLNDKQGRVHGEK